MKNILWFGYLVTLGLFMLVGFLSKAHADEPTPQEKDAEVNRKIDVLAQEVEKLKAGKELFPAVGEGKYGFAPAASKVYSSRGGISLGGYGEMLYSHPLGDDESGAPSGMKDQLDFVRAILYTGYKFNQSILFNSEVEFEHTTTEGAGAVSVEFAYLDFLWKEGINLRAGLLLMPVGLTNELHEPPVFMGAQKPRTETQIIPGTWGEPGIGVFGGFNDFTYRAYLVTGFDGVGGGRSKAAGFAADGLRDARQKGSEATAEGLAAVARADYAGLPGLLVGVSGYVGNSGQGNRTPTGQKISAVTTLTEAHMDYRTHGWEVRGLFAYAHVNKAGRVNAAKTLAGQDSVGEALMGYYAQVGYDVLRSLETQQQLIPFFRFEALNTQFRVPAGFAKKPQNDQNIYTVGLSYKPIMNIVVKTDYEFHRNGAGTGVDQFNLGLGYLF